MTYPEAIKWLGRKYGIEVKEKELTDTERIEQSERESMFVLNEWANNYFQKILHDNVDGVAVGMAYFRSRGFRDDIIKKFDLGYSLEQRDAFANAAIAHGFSKEYLLKTGLCYQTEEGKLFDRYHGRVIFPVHTVSGRVVAFGGRVLNTDRNKNVGKYVNSPESEIYSKSHELYGLYQAKQAIVKQGRCFLVEGYTDVISMHQSGVENVVASSGTSLTEGQIRLLHRFTENITVLYDGDAAGIKASLRGIDMLLAEGMNIKVLLLPNGDDPDSFARKHRAEDFQNYIEQHQVDFIKFKTDLLLAGAGKDPIKRAELISDVVHSISVIPNEVVRQMYIKESAIALTVSEELIVNEINKQHSKQSASDYSNDGSKQKHDITVKQGVTSLATNPIKGNAEEEMLASLVVKFGNMYIDATISEISGNSEEQITVAEFIDKSLKSDGLTLTTPLLRQILAEALKFSTNNNWDPLPYFLNHADPQISKFAAIVGQENFILSSRQREQYVEDKYKLDDLVPRVLHDYKHAVIKGQLQQILMQLRNPQLQADTFKTKSLMKEYMQLSQIERKLAKVLGDRVVLK